MRRAGVNPGIDPVDPHAEVPHIVTETVYLPLRTVMTGGRLRTVMVAILDTSHLHGIHPLHHHDELISDLGEPVAHQGELRIEVVAQIRAVMVGGLLGRGTGMLRSLSGLGTGDLGRSPNTVKLP